MFYIGSDVAHTTTLYVRTFLKAPGTQEFVAGGGHTQRKPAA
jgi:hypothetical protein